MYVSVRVYVRFCIEKGVEGCFETQSMCKSDLTSCLYLLSCVLFEMCECYLCVSTEIWNQKVNLICVGVCKVRPWEAQWNQSESEQRVLRLR